MERLDEWVARANAEARGNRYRPDFPRLFVELILGWNRWAVAITAALIIAGLVVLGRQSLRRKLRVFATDKHSHAAQQPKVLDLNKKSETK